MSDNKLGITNEVELAKVEEKISKENAKRFYDSGDINNLEIGTYKGLTDIHNYSFDERS